MLTCKLGENTINCFDGIYKKEQLKKWANKNILICPVCNKPYEYCHGRVISPYFRHKDKDDCDYAYSEPETEEHVKGKQILYEWVKSLNGVTDVILEGWLPETKQRPDIMFKIDDKQYVIEYQCTPIASEYFERHDLYQAAGITDIWILGVEKYNIINSLGKIKKAYGNRVIEKNTPYYFSPIHKTIYMSNTIIRDKLPYKCLRLDNFFEYDLYDCIINSNIISKDMMLNEFIEADIQIYNKTICEFKKCISQGSVIKKAVSKLNSFYKKIDKQYEVKLEKYPEYEYETYYWNGRKYNRSKISYYTYSICLYHYLYKDKFREIASVDLTNMINAITDKIEIFKYIKECFESIEINITCKECKEVFKLNLRELEFYSLHDLILPKRCKQCRNKRKQGVVK